MRSWGWENKVHQNMWNVPIEICCNYLGKDIYLTPALNDNVKLINLTNTYDL